MTAMRRAVVTAALATLSSVAGACFDNSSAQSSVRRIETYRNAGSAMHPTLREGQLLGVTLFDDSAMVSTEVRRGDIVAYRWPVDTSRKWVKRVVGLPGDTLEMSGGILSVNGVPVHEPYAVRTDSVPLAPTPEIEEVTGKRRDGKKPDRDNWGPLVVPPKSYFVLGDNRAHSLDSRYWGFVPASHVLGRARARAAGSQ